MTRSRHLLDLFGNTPVMEAMEGARQYISLARYFLERPEAAEYAI